MHSIFSCHSNNSVIIQLSFYILQEEGSSCKHKGICHLDNLSHIRKSGISTIKIFFFFTQKSQFKLSNIELDFQQGDFILHVWFR